MSSERETVEIEGFEPGGKSTYSLEADWFGFPGRDWAYVTATTYNWHSAERIERTVILLVPNTDLRAWARRILDEIPEVNHG